MAKPVVALTRCVYSSSDREVDEAVRSTIALAGGLPDRVVKARKILIKPNYVGASSKSSDAEIKRHGGRFVSCAEPAVTRAVVALVREANPTAEIVFAEGVDAPPHRTAEDVFRAMDEIGRAHV